MSKSQGKVSHEDQVAAVVTDVQDLPDRQSKVGLNRQFRERCADMKMSKQKTRIDKVCLF